MNIVLPNSSKISAFKFDTQFWFVLELSLTTKQPAGVVMYQFLRPMPNFKQCSNHIIEHIIIASYVSNVCRGSALFTVQKYLGPCI